jgi:hypothetical protein
MSWAGASVASRETASNESRRICSRKFCRRVRREREPAVVGHRGVTESVETDKLVSLSAVE